MTQEKNSQISDIDKAWTAANAENEARKTGVQKWGKNPSPIEREVIEAYALKRGEKRIANYNPAEEVALDALRDKALQLIQKCEFHLQQEFGSIEQAEKVLKHKSRQKSVHGKVVLEGYSYLLEAIGTLKGTIKYINLDKAEVIKKVGADFLMPQVSIPETEAAILRILGFIKEAKSKQNL